MEKSMTGAAVGFKKRGKFFGTKKKRNMVIFAYCMLALPLLQMAVFSIYVNIDAFVLSFQTVNRYGEYSFSGFANYVTLFRDIAARGQYSEFLIALKYSLPFFLVNNCILLPLSLLFSYFLYKRIKGTGIFRVIFFLPSVISIVVLTLVYKFMFSGSFGPVDLLMRAMGMGNLIPEGGWLATPETSFPLVILYCVWAGVGYNIVLTQGAISRVPKEVIESGEIDGIGMTRELLQIIVPLISPTLITMIVLGSTSVFTTFLQPMLITCGDKLTGVTTLAMLIVANTKNGSPVLQIRAATIGTLLTAVGAPLIVLLQWGLNKLAPDVDF